MCSNEWSTPTEDAVFVDEEDSPPAVRSVCSTALSWLHHRQLRQNDKVNKQDLAWLAAIGGPTKY